MSHVIIATEGACYRYADDARDAVSCVSLEIEAGSFFAILGPNGSGKSTLAKLFNALYIPVTGDVFVAGINTRDEARLYEIREQCGMVFQNPDNQLVATVVEEDVAFGLENMGVPPGEIRRRVDEALDMVGMGDFKKAAPHMLSGGQKQRVAIAGVLAMRPRAIVFDEATAMLDPVGRRDVMRVVEALNKDEGITIIWITHFMSEAARADRIAVMDEGKIQMRGTPREVFLRPEAVRAHGLDVPEMAQLSEDLRAEGVLLPDGILTIDEMAEALCRLKLDT
jgi:energy-coupling factor transport system ATP-binding protein